MITNISHIQLLVNSYEEAIDFYTNKLGFVLCGDDPMPQMGEGMRWVVIAPNKENKTMISLVKATLEPSISLVGKQGGDYPILVILCDDIEADISSFKSKGVIIKSPIGSQPWGKDCTIEDLYGNMIYVVEEPKK
jgi:predicted enzyme related to lactoylglutathione lyase